MVKNSAEFEDNGRVLRLVLVSVWILSLSLYSVWFTHDSVPYSDLLNPPDKQHGDGIFDRDSAAMHFDVAERESNASEKILWKCFIAPMRILATRDPNAPVRFQEMTEQSENVEMRFENYSGPTRLGEGISHHIPLRWLPLLNDRLNRLLIGIAIAMLLILGGSFSRDAEWRKRYLWMVTAAGMALIITVQAIFTYLQGGLLVSPMGYIFSTVMAFLLVHARNTWAISTRMQRFVFWGLPVLLFGLSLVADILARAEFSSTAIFLMRYLYQPEYGVFFWITVLLGAVASFSRPAIKRQMDSEATSVATASTGA